MSGAPALGDVLELFIDNRGKNPPFESSGVPLLSGRSITDHGIDMNATRFVSQETYQQWMPRPLRKGDLILTSEAPLGRVVLVDTDAPIALGQRIFGMRGRQGVLDTRFLYYLFMTPRVRADLAARATGTTVLGIRQPELMKIRIPAPAYPQQRAIAEVLGALDDKIATNDHLSRAALALAEATFKRCVLQSTYASALGEVATTMLGGTPSRVRPELWNGGTVPWIASGKANQDRILEPSEWITEEALATSAAKLMPQGATVIAITGATLGQIARLEIATSGNQSLVGIWHDDPALNDWIYFAVRQEIDELLKHATGAAQQHVNKGAVDALQIPVPSGEMLSEWGTYTRSLLDAAAQADRESIRLSATRDGLLPLLMSGTVRVRDVERIVEGRA